MIGCETTTSYHRISTSKESQSGKGERGKHLRNNSRLNIRRDLIVDKIP